MRDIKKPIFIIGSGRSGTTIFYKLMSVHPELCWFPKHMKLFPNHVWSSTVHRVFELPLIGVKFKKTILSPKKALRLLPYHPYEGDNIHALLDENNTDAFRKVIEDSLKYSGKNRFLNKQTTNYRRLKLLNQIFPDAKFIHVIRDGRAVANSYLRVNWKWLKKRIQEWEVKGVEPIEKFAIHWKDVVDKILENKELLGDRYMEIKYEQLTNDTRGILRKAIDFCELDWSDRYSNFLPETLPNMDYKWREQLTEKQKSILDDCIGETLIQLGYKK